MPLQQLQNTVQHESAYQEQKVSNEEQKAHPKQQSSTPETSEALAQVQVQSDHGAAAYTKSAVTVYGLAMRAAKQALTDQFNQAYQGHPGKVGKESSRYDLSESEAESSGYGSSGDCDD